MIEQGMENLFSQLDAAISYCYDKQEALFFLQEAYQETIFIRIEMKQLTSEKQIRLMCFLNAFYEFNKKFIAILNDRYCITQDELQSDVEKLKIKAGNCLLRAG